MNNFRKYRIEFWIIGTLLFLWTTSIFAEECYLFYDDGTIKEAGAPSRASVEAPPSEDATVTLDVKAIIMDSATGQEVFEVHPGQIVTLWCFFNRLGDLEVPFDQLIGHEISFSYRLFGILKYQDQFAFPIEYGQEGYQWVGVTYIVPIDALPGKFLYVTSAKISGFQVENNRDRGVYAVVK
jgi:hypothetical protein